MQLAEMDCQEAAAAPEGASRSRRKESGCDNGRLEGTGLSGDCFGPGTIGKPD
jgi:hypothetical protein